MKTIHHPVFTQAQTFHLFVYTHMIELPLPASCKAIIGMEFTCTYRHGYTRVYLDYVYMYTIVSLLQIRLVPASINNCIMIWHV